MMSSLFRPALALALAIAATTASAQGSRRAPYWSTHAGENHWAQAPAPVQPLQKVLWSMPIDLDRQYSFGTLLLIHYGSPLLTGDNKIIVPVKTGAADGFRVEVRNAVTGALHHIIETDYTIATGNGWFPSFSPVLDPKGGLHIPAVGGTVLYKQKPGVANGATRRRAFVGLRNYLEGKDAYDANVKINTPLSSDRRGNVFFGYQIYGDTPLGLQSGIARIGFNGVGKYRSAVDITGDAFATKIQTQCAPAFSLDQRTVYVAIQRSGGGGWLVGLDSATLETRYITRLYDPFDGSDAIITSQSTSSPMIAPDGDVYFGILVNSHTLHNGRGYLMRFDKTLTVQKTPGSFGWDLTPALVPAEAAPGYAGTSPYLILTKYNNYAGFGTGDGVNQVALLDPFDTQPDAISGIDVMKEVYTKPGPTPDPNNVGPEFPNAVWEWCINSAAIDVATHSAIINSEDGIVYRWDLSNNTLSQGVPLDGPRGQAYTMTITGPTGIAYAINNGILFAVGADTP